jgi:hypothetical protein
MRGILMLALEGGPFVHASLLRRQDILCQAFGPNPGQRSQNVAHRLCTGDGVDALRQE